MGGLSAQQSLETNFRMTGAGVLDVFEPQRQVIQKSSAVIYEGRKEIAYGVVVTADGYILSKASELDGKSGLDVRVDREIFKDVKVVLVDPKWDVVLLKVEATDLAPAEYAESDNPAQGTWVVVNGATSRTNRRILAGIVSAKLREIPPEGGAVLGLLLGKAEDRLEISEVTEGGGAEQAGLKKGDIITSADGKNVSDVAALTKLLKKKSIGDSVKLTIKRGKENLELDVRLSARGELFAQATRNDQMSGDFSKRRSGFPQIIQHDILANSNTMGGPVIGLDGKLLGMNIARANRAETFAIPAADLERLATGMVAEARK
jgi:serine protease Do